MGNRISPAAEEGRVLPALPVTTLLTISRDGHFYAFVYTDENRREAMRWAGKHAANPELNFTWVDASMVTKSARDMAPKNGI